MGHIDQIVRHQPLAIKGGLVADNTEFVLDAALDKIVGNSWQTPLGHLTEIIDIDRAIHVHLILTVKIIAILTIPILQHPICHPEREQPSRVEGPPRSDYEESLVFLNFSPPPVKD